MDLRTVCARLLVYTHETAKYPISQFSLFCVWEVSECIANMELTQDIVSLKAVTQRSLPWLKGHQWMIPSLVAHLGMKICTLHSAEEKLEKYLVISKNQKIINQIMIYINVFQQTSIIVFLIPVFLIVFLFFYFWHLFVANFFSLNTFLFFNSNVYTLLS